MPEWQVLNARLTFFVTPDAILPSALGQDLVGDEPQRSARQRALSLKSDSGPFAEGTLTLNVLPSRVDWVYEALASPITGAINRRAPRGFARLAHVTARTWPTEARPAIGPASRAQAMIEGELE